MKIVDNRNPQKKCNDLYTGSIVSYCNNICIVNSWEGEYRVVSLENGRTLKIYDALSDVESDPSVKQLDEEFNCEFTIGSDF